MKIRSGDNVKIISGKDRGRTGKVEKVFPEKGRVRVSGVHVVKRHVRPTRDFPEGGRIEKSLPIAVSNAMLICPDCHQPTRVGYRTEGSRKYRVCKKCGAVIK